MAIQLTIMSIDFDSFEEPVTKTFHKSEITLGSDDANDIVLDRSEISRSHAKILCKVNGNGHTPSLYITDLGSTNGTLVERDSIRPGVEIPLKNHQRVVIGSYLIKPIFVPDSEKPESESRKEEVTQDAPVHAEPATGSIAAMAAQKKAEEPEEAPVSTEALFEKEKAVVREAERAPTPAAEPAQPVRAAKPTNESNQHKQELERLEKVATPVATPSQPVAPAPRAEPTRPVVPTPSVEPTSPAEPVRPSMAKAVLHVPSAIRIRLDGKSVEGVKIVAKKLVTFRGLIHCSGGAVPGVKISAGKYGDTTSAADGSFQIKDIVEGDQLTLAFAQEGYRFRDFHGPVVNEVPVTIVATKLHTLRGRIAHKGSGLGGVLVDAGVVGKTLTGADGGFEFRSITAGTEYVLTVSKDRFQIESATAKGTVDKDVDLKFTARELFAISGFVIHNGTPLAGVEVECINFGKTVTDSTGKYVFENVPEGEEYAIVAHKEGFAFDGE